MLFLLMPLPTTQPLSMQWNAYGHDIQSFAEVASRFNHSVSMLHNPEAAAAAAVTPKPVRRFAQSSQASVNWHYMFCGCTPERM